jgi:hypothetical protein
LLKLRQGTVGVERAWQAGDETVMFGGFFRRGQRSQKNGASQSGWGPEGDAVALFAAANIVDYLFDDLKGPRGIHVETLMTMAGALAGFSAQHAIWETIVKTGKLPEHGGMDMAAGAFIVAETDGGEKFYFGDLLNSFLVPQEGGNARLGPDGSRTLWAAVAGAVEKCRRKPMSQDEIGKIFRNAAATGGSALFGQPRLPQCHQPHMTPRSALNRTWPKVKLILGRRDAPAAEGVPLPPDRWPTVVALVAGHLILLTKDTLDPSLSMRIIFEAAIPMSKVDPRTVPGGVAGD